MHARKVFGSIAVCVSLLGLQVAIGEAQAASGTVTGTVFNDKDSNGTNGGADVGVSGVVVSAYDSSGAQVGTATTTSNGTYSLSIASSTNSNVRVEFTTPSGYEPSFQGANNATSIQFVTIPATNVDYAVIVPGTGAYCEANPDFGAICIRPGTTSSQSSTSSSVTQSGWKGNSTQRLTQNAHTGSLWGMAFDAKNQHVYASAVLRRHSGLGPRGIAGIYVTDRTSGNVLVSWDLSAAPYGLTFSANNATFTDANRGLSNSTVFSNDVPAYANIGKVGIGDIDMSQDGQWLFVTNLYEKKIHRFAVTDTDSDGVPELGAATSYAIPGGTCTNNTARPWGLSYNDVDNTVLIGVVCSREDQTPSLGGGTTSVPDPGKILKLMVATSTFSTLSDVDFDYARSVEIESSPGSRSCNTSTSNPSSDTCLLAKWHSWTDQFSTISTFAAQGDLEGQFNCPSDGQTCLFRRLWWPQPVISDIEVLPSGEIVVGVLDRFGLQMGLFNFAPIAGNTDRYTGWVAGDTLLLCPSSGSYIQNNADDCTPATEDDAYMLRNGGLGGLQAHREVFDDNVDNPNGANSHQEITIGGFAYNAPTKELLMTAMDADNSWYNGGVRYLNGDSSLSSFGQYAGGTTFNGLFDGGFGNNQYWDSSFSKATSMGDVELLCDQEPVQIGNRVWIDTNENGIQDPGEPPVVGVSVYLYAATGSTGFFNQLGSATTNANGEYFFSSNLDESVYGNGDHIGGGLVKGNAYRIRMDWPRTYTTGVLAGYELTQALATSTSTSLDSSVDNDATLVDEFPQISVPIVTSGANNHTYDFGFKLIPVSTTTTITTTTTTVASSSPTPASDSTTTPTTPTTTTPIQVATVIKVSVGDYVWWDKNQDGIQDRTEKGIPDVVLSIRTADGKPVIDVDGKAVQRTKTNRNGRYSFDNLPPGQYEVFVADPRGYFPTTALAGSDRGVDSSTRSSMSVNLTQNGQRDPTLDFGFYKPPRTESVLVGNFVWKDRNGNGIQGSGDTGIAGALMTLTTVDNMPVRDIFGRRVRSQTTKRDGKYLFTDLPPGQYVVRIKYPPKHFATTANKPNRAMNSSSHKAFSKTLMGGQSDLTLDFGMIYRSGDPVLPLTR